MTVTIEYLTDKRVYAYLAGAWVDITNDVYVPDKIRCAWGMSGSTPLDRLAGTGTMYFTLNNASKKYSPDSVSVLAGWKRGVPVKLVLSYDGLDYVRFRGSIDTIAIDAGTKSDRRVYVSVVGWMDYAAKYPLVNPGLLQNKRADEGLTTLLAGMPIQPQATDYAAGVTTFLTLFDTVTTKTKAYSEFSKLALSEVGYIYIRRDKTYGETLVFESNHSRSGLDELTPFPKSILDSGFLLKEDGGYLLLETGGKIILDEAQTASVDNTMIAMTNEYGKAVINRITITAYPKRVDTSNHVLFTLSSPLLIGAGQTVTFRAGYSDPSGGAVVNAMPGTMVTPASGTDYAMFQNSDATGTNYTANLTVVAVYGTEGVTYTLTNGAAVSAWVTLLQARGYGVYSYNPTESSQEDADSYNEFGYQSLTLAQMYQQTVDVGIIEGAKILDREKQPRTVLNKVTMIANKSSADMEAFLNLDIGDIIYIKEDQTGIDGNYYIQGVEFSISDERVIMFSWIVKEFLSLALGLSLIGAQFPGGIYTNSGISYGYIPEINNLTKMTISGWVYRNPDGATARYLTNYVKGAGGYIVSVNGATGKINWLRIQAGGPSWSTSGNVTLSQWSNFVISADITGPGNPPNIYIDGVLQSVAGTPSSGAFLDSTGASLTLGADFTGGGDQDCIDGIEKDVRIYNRALSATEALKIFTDGPGVPTVTDGLVFQGPAIRTKEAANYENLPLAASNKLLDNIFGVIGTPKGLPVSELIYPNSSPGGNVTFVSVNSQTGVAVTGMTWTHTVAPGSNRLLVVEVALRGSDTVDSITATVAGVSRRLAKFSAAEQGNTYGDSRVEIWYLIAPTVGVNTITLTAESTVTSGLSYLQAGSMDFINVNQLTPFGAFASANGTSTAPTVNAVGASGDLIIDILSTWTTATVGAGQTERFNVTSDTSWRGAGSTEAGGVSVTMSWTLGSSQKWQIGAFAIKAAP